MMKRFSAYLLIALSVGCTSVREDYSHELTGAGEKYESGDTAAAIRILEQVGRTDNYWVNTVLAHAYVESNIPDYDLSKVDAASELLARVSLDSISNTDLREDLILQHAATVNLLGRREDSARLIDKICPRDSAHFIECFKRASRAAINGALMSTSNSPRLSHETAYFIADYSYTIYPDPFYDAARMFSLANLNPDRTLDLRQSLIDSKRYDKRVQKEFCEIAVPKLAEEGRADAALDCPGAEH